MVKKNVKGKTGHAAGTSSVAPGPDAAPAHASESASKRLAAPRKKAAAGKSPRAATSSAKPPVRQAAASSRPARAATDDNALRALVAPGFEAILAHLRSVQQMIEKLVAQPPGTTDAALDASVDSLRRLLSELIEQRMESVVRDLADVRREAANLAEGSGGRIVERLDRLLEDLGAVRFDAEPMDVVDPLIHVVVDERHQLDVPDGVILETQRPGYRTARGMVVCKAAVVVNQRS